MAGLDNKITTVLSKGCMVVALGVLLGACAPAGPADRGPGERLFRSKCGACHIRPRPGRFTRSGWEKLLDEHKKRVPLTPHEREEMLNFLGGDDNEQ